MPNADLLRPPLKELDRDLTLLKQKALYNMGYPLRYAADALRSSLSSKSTETCRILIASDNLVGTSEVQFKPLLTDRRRIFDELGVIFDQRLIDDVLASGKSGSSAYDAVLAKLSFHIPAEETIAKITRLRQLFPHPVKLIYFDGDDDSCIQWSGLVEIVDLYVKKHLFSDMTWYRKTFNGKNNLTDYVSKISDRSFADNIIPHSGSVPEGHLDKIVLGYNIGMDDKITDLYRDTRPSTASEKTVDVMCRAACKPEQWIYPLRNPINAALEPLTAAGRSILVPNQRVDQQGYYQEMRSARICVSPFGYGELCWRDFETVLMGSLLVKPDMSHIRTEPDIFVPHETYVPVRWDFSDLAEVCEHYLKDDAARNSIIARAYERLSDYYTSFGFIKSFQNILSKAAVHPFAHSTGEVADAVSIARS